VRLWGSQGVIATLLQDRTLLADALRRVFLPVSVRGDVVIGKEHLGRLFAAFAL
jgi:hypothetical protein